MTPSSVKESGYYTATGIASLTKPATTGFYTATGIASETKHSNGTASSTVRVPVNGTISTTGPKPAENTGGAALVSVGQGVIAVAMGALGVAML